MSTVTVPLDRLIGPSRRQRRRERRRLEHLDALSARLAELHAIRDLVEKAAAIVSSGWVQGAWFTVAVEGGERAVTAYDLRLAADRNVTGACLVGSVVQAAGGPASARSQLVQRTLDLAGHTLGEDPGRPVRWCPGPSRRMTTVLELTRWNDAPGRMQHEVVDLLLAAGDTAEVQRDLCHTERADLARSRA
ncbi:MAG: hypothetical protein ABI776_13300 [Nocardioidaceae bacterium]